jgi:dTDP-4-dehydrorhamnose 3,5-epimerase
MRRTCGKPGQAARIPASFGVIPGIAPVHGLGGQLAAPLLSHRNETQSSGTIRMIFTETKLKGAYLIDLEPHIDDRGFFARAFCQREFEAHGLKPVIAQANIGFNKRKGTLRGMHFQFPPAAETKLVRASRGTVLDIIVDLRPESPTYLQHVSVELSADNHRGIYIPERFAHGYLALEDNTETTYHVGEFYTPGSEGGLLYNDPRLGLVWPLPVSTISDKDREWKPLDDIEPELRARMRGSALEVLR